MNLGLGFSFPGPTGAPSTNYPDGSLSDLQATKARGANFAGMPVGYGFDPAAARTQAELMLSVFGAVFVSFHLDNGANPDSVKLMPLLDFAAYQEQLQTLCVALKGTGAIISLWNEQTYSAAQSLEYHLSWNDIDALYANAGPLVEMIRDNGCLVSVPFPGDQSPEVAMQMGAQYFPLAQMQALKPDYCDLHLYPNAPGSLPYRLGIARGVALAVGAPLVLSETNALYPAPGPLSVAEWEAVVKPVTRCYFPYRSDPAEAWDMSENLGAWPALTASA